MSFAGIGQAGDRIAQMILANKNRKWQEHYRQQELARITQEKADEETKFKQGIEAAKVVNAGLEVPSVATLKLGGDLKGTPTIGQSAAREIPATPEQIAQRIPGAMGELSERGVAGFNAGMNAYKTALDMGFDADLAKRTAEKHFADMGLTEAQTLHEQKVAYRLEHPVPTEKTDKGNVDTIIEIDGRYMSVSGAESEYAADRREFEALDDDKDPDGTKRRDLLQKMRSASAVISKYYRDMKLLGKTPLPTAGSRLMGSPGQTSVSDEELKREIFGQ